MNTLSYYFIHIINYGFTENKESLMIHNYVSMFTHVPDGKKYPTFRKIHFPNVVIWYLASSRLQIIFEIFTLSAYFARKKQP